jgi:hypothetical protein
MPNLRPQRRSHAVERPAPDPAPVAAAPVADDHPHERRARESGGPIDQAHYSCSCGLAFEAPVSTSVSCPHCGTGQAW